MNSRIFWTACFLLTASTTANADAIRDVTFATRYASGRPKTADFYYCDRAIGSGREAFQVIVDRIKQLPPGTSIVWGPNYDRCGACSGSEPGCVPKFLYPDLWKELEKEVQDRRLILSNSYPSVRQRMIRSGVEFPRAVTEGTEEEHGPYDAVLEWKIGPAKSEPSKQRKGSATRTHQFSAKGVGLEAYQLEYFFGRLPEKSRVLIRMSLQEGEAIPASTEEMRLLLREIRDTWTSQIARKLQLGSLSTTLTAFPELLKELNARPDKITEISISWKNFRGPQTPHDEVVYEVNERFIGRGDAGFDQLLMTLSNLPRDSEIELPRYWLGGRLVLQSMKVEELKAKNATLASLVPFAARQSEFDDVIRERKINVVRSNEYPSFEVDTVLAWSSGDRSGRSFVSSGRLVRHEEKPRPPAARLGWSNYAAEERYERKPERTATITLDDYEMGAGTAGFARALERLAELPAGSVVHVRVCIRTEAPFRCPIIFEGQRHFERTGFEPYFGLFPWLIDVAHARKLELEWIPDEKKSCEDCELNK